MIGTPSVNLHSPGPIGDTTPATVAGTTLTLNPAPSGKTIVINTSDFVRINAVGGFNDIAIEFGGTVYYEISSSAFQLDGNTVVAFSRSALATFQCYTLPGGAGITGFASGVGGLSCVQNGAEVLTWSATAITLTSGIALQLGNAATTGLTPGVLAATTNASIVIKDSSGTSYRVPCIV